MRFVPTSESADRCKSVPAGSRAWAGGRKRVEEGGVVARRDRRRRGRRNVFHLSFYLGLP